MKHLLVILACLTSTIAFAQTEEIYRLVFSDKSNFELTKFFEHKIPNEFLVIDTTKTWNSKRFWLTSFDNNDKEKIIQKIKNDEHHPYFHSYLFSDTVLNKLFTDSTKKSLSIQSKNIKSRHIKLKGPSYRTITSSKNVKGYYFVTSEPFLSNDKDFAFVDITVFYKQQYKQPFDETYFGTICIVFQKQDGAWKRIAKKDWLIL